MAERLLRTWKGFTPLDRRSHLTGFTVMELMLAVMIVTIIAAMSTAGYTRYRDKAAMLVDETNQKVLLAAVKLFAYDTNALPGSLSDLRDSDLRRAYAQVTEGKKPFTVFAFLKEELAGLGIAEASDQPLPDRYIGSGGDTLQQRQRLLTCPVDPTPPSAGGHSYAIHQQCLNGDSGRPLSWLLDPANAARTVIGESDRRVATDADFVRRHEGGRTFVRASASGVITRDRSNTSGPGG